MGKPVVGYWKNRGLAQPIRLLLAFCGQDWEDRLYEEGEAPSFDQTEWLREKFSLNLEYPNLPFYVDDNVRITHSGAIMRYLAEKYGLLGSTAEARTKADMAYFELDDWRMQFLALFYIYYGEGDAKERFTKMAMHKYLLRFARLLHRDGRDYVAGKEITYVDIFLYEMLEWSLYLDPTCLSMLPGLQTFRKRIADLPGIKAYLNSDRYIAWPLVGARAKFGSKQEDQQTRRAKAYLRMNSIF